MELELLDSHYLYRALTSNGEVWFIRRWSIDGGFYIEEVDARGCGHEVAGPFQDQHDALAYLIEQEEISEPVK